VSQLRLMLAVASFGFSAGGDVAHDERVMFSAHQVETAGAELDRECIAIRPPRINLPTTSLRGQRMSGGLQSVKQIGYILDQFRNVVSD
jgi:hypothetical protein